MNYGIQMRDLVNRMPLDELLHEAVDELSLKKLQCEEGYWLYHLVKIISTSIVTPECEVVIRNMLTHYYAAGGCRRSYAREAAEGIDGA